MSVPATYNLDASIDAMYDKLEGNALGRMAVVGDSIAFRPAWHSHLWAELATEFGSGGYGYRGINPDFKYVNFAGVAELKVAYAGTATNIVKGKGTSKRDQTWGLYSPDGIFSRLRYDGQATVTIPSGHTLRLHYLRQPGGGTLIVKRSGVQVLAQSTDGTLGNATASLATGTKFSFSGLGAAWVQVHALEMTKATGFVLDRLGRGQDNPHNYNTGNTPSSSSVLAALAPDLMLIQTDWYTPNQSQGSFTTDLGAYIDFVRLAVPSLPIVLVAHHAMSEDSTTVSEVLYAIAQAKGCGFIDHLQVKTYSEMVSLGYIQADGVHLSDAGGAFFAHYDAELFRSTR